MLRRNISFSFIEKCLTSTVGALISIYLINYLGPEKYGVFSYLSSLVYLFGILTFPGINNVIIKHIAQGKNSSYLISASFYLSLVTSVVAFLFMLLFINNKDEGLMMFAVFSSLTIFNTISSVFKSYFNGMQKIDVLVKINIIIFFIISSIKLAAIYLRLDFVFFFQLIVFETILQISLFGYFYLKNDHLVVNKKIINILKIIIVESFPLFLTSLVIMLYVRIDQVMIEYFVGFKQLGQYSASVRLVDMCYMLSPIILASLYPYLSSQYKKNKNIYTDHVKSFIFLFSFLSIPIVLFTMFYSSELITFIFSDKFDKADVILQILILSTPFVFWNSLLYKVLIIEKMMRISFYSSVASLLINIGLNYFLIPSFGAIGASVATVISYGVFIFIIPFIDGLRFYIVAIIKSLLTPIFLTLVSLSLVYQLNEYVHILISGITFLGIYAVSTYILFRNRVLEERLVDAYNIIYKGN